MANCNVCGFPLKPGKPFCGNCGRPVNVAEPSPVTEKCPSCHSNVKPGKRFCGKCGHSLTTPQPRPPLKPRKRRFGRALFRLVMITTAFLAVYVVVKNRSIPDEPVSLPRGDREFLEKFYGSPPYFSIIMGEGGATTEYERREVWIYPEKRAAFVFFNGKHQASYEIKLDSSGATSVNLNPKQVNEMLSPDDFDQLMGDKPVKTVKISENLLPDAVWNEYANGVIALFNHGRLVMTKAMPLRNQ